MPHVAELTPTRQTTPFRCGWTCSLAGGLTTIGLYGSVLQADIPLWFQPTAVGIAWGMLFSIGLYLGSVGQYQFLPAAIGLTVAYAMKSALQALTDLNGAECCWLVCALAVAGWLASRPIHIFASGEQTEALGSVRGPARTARRFTWTIWDLGWLTTLVAICASSLSQIQSSPAILNQVAIALSGGLVASWTACAWAVCDKWTHGRLAALGVVVLGSLALMALQAPNAASPWQVASWMLVGPVAVASAQGITVMSIIALARLDAKLEHEATNPSATIFNDRRTRNVRLGLSHPASVTQDARRTTPLELSPVCPAARLFVPEGD